MNTIKASDLIKQRGKLNTTNPRNFNIQVLENEPNPNVCVAPLKPVSLMNTFRRNLNQSLRDSLREPLPESTQTRKETVYRHQNTKRTVRKRSQSSNTLQTNTSQEVQTDKVVINVDDMYSFLNLEYKHKNKCKEYTLKGVIITLCITAYTAGIMCFQHYILD